MSTLQSTTITVLPSPTTHQSTVIASKIPLSPNHCVELPWPWEGRCILMRDLVRNKACSGEHPLNRCNTSLSSVPCKSSLVSLVVLTLCIFNCTCQCHVLTLYMHCVYFCRNVARHCLWLKITQSVVHQPLLPASHPQNALMIYAECVVHVFKKHRC